jgi:hypothetical protein
VPLLFLDYNLRLDGTNSAPPGRQTYKLLVDGQPFAPAPEVTGLRVDVSTDDGATWEPARVKDHGGGVFKAITTNPDSGYVSLRVSATAADGSTVEEEIIRAYQIAE